MIKVGPSDTCPMNMYDNQGDAIASMQNSSANAGIAGAQGIGKAGPVDADNSKSGNNAKGKGKSGKGKGVFLN